MAKKIQKHYSIAEKAQLLYQIEDSIKNGMGVAKACAEFRVPYATYYGWKQDKALIANQIKLAQETPASAKAHFKQADQPDFITEAINKEVNAFMNELDKRIHEAMENAVKTIYERYNG
jgi:hypothetical protein